MDYDKLIERLRTESLYADKASLEIMDLCMDAATALSTLQAENEKLRAELAQADREGRCVVLPPDDYTWTIRGDIVRGIIHANCRAAKKEAEAVLQGEREEKQ